MKVFLLVILLLLVSTIPAQVELEETLPYDYVCEQVSIIYPEVSCDDIPVPTVVYTSALELLGMNGLYMAGEYIIFINTFAVDPDTTLLHELTHYVTVTTGVEGPEDKCKAEETARYIAGQTYEWRQRYGCDLSTTD